MYNPRVSLKKLLTKKQLCQFLCIIITLFTINGCATYGSDISEAKQAMQAGDYEAARNKIKSQLKPSGDDALLYYLEFGLLEHLAGNYQLSNELLSTAEDIAESLYTKKSTDILQVLMTNPRSGPYRGAAHERVLLSYIKAMNYFMLAEASESTSQKSTNIEAARIESRRANIQLLDIEAQQGSYQDAKDEKESTFGKLMQIFAALTNDHVDKEKLVYRQDAWINYMMGVSFEQNKEWDDARISYQKSAELYETGYQEQYELSKDMTSQAWIDTVRMMRKAGWKRWEWKRLAKKKLSPQQIANLEAMGDKAQLLIIDHVGVVPEIKELNLVMRLQGTDLLLQPIIVGDPQEQKDQFAWFFMIYSDVGILNLIQNYNRGGGSGAIEGLYSAKNFGIAPMYEVANLIGLVSTLEKAPVRVTVPYMAPLNDNQLPQSALRIDGEQYAMYKSASIARLSFYNALLNADKEIQLAVARESLKAVLAQKAAELATDQVGSEWGSLISLATSAVSASLSKAETRSWLFLPYEIRVRRMAIKPGTHNLEIARDANTPPAAKNKIQINVNEGDVYIWKNRQF